MPVHAYRFGPKELPCGPGSRLVIGLTSEGLWDAVYYRPRFAGDLIGQRHAITKAILLDALRVLFAEAGEPFDADATIAYIQATTWGMRLPRMTAERKPRPMPQDERLAEEHGWSPEEPESHSGDPGAPGPASGALLPLEAEW